MQNETIDGWMQTAQASMSFLLVPGLVGALMGRIASQGHGTLHVDSSNSGVRPMDCTNC